jgi:hypothetical protein
MVPPTGPSGARRRPRLLSPQNENYSPTSWSLSSKRLAGQIRSADGATASVAIYSVGSQQFTRAPGDLVRGNDWYIRCGWPTAAVCSSVVPTASSSSMPKPAPAGAADHRRRRDDRAQHRRAARQPMDHLYGNRDRGRYLDRDDRSTMRPLRARVAMHRTPCTCAPHRRTSRTRRTRRICRTQRHLARQKQKPEVLTLGLWQ